MFILRTLPRTTLILKRQLHRTCGVAGVKPKVEEDGDSKVLPWHLSSSVLVERIPTLSQDPTDLQTRMSEMLLRVENERSLLNDHEIRSRTDQERAERRKRGEDPLLDGGAADADLASSLKSATDDEDDWKRERGEFVPAPRRTEADERKDVKSTTRAMERPLRLMVKLKLGEDLVWDLPTAIRSEGETMRQAAERALSECCGGGLQALVLGNAPWAFYRQTYSRRVREELGHRGQKVFIFKAHFVKGEVKPQGERTKDFWWALREEMEGNMDKRTMGAVEEIIFEEDP